MSSKKHEALRSALSSVIVPKEWAERFSAVELDIEEVNATFPFNTRMDEFELLCPMRFGRMLELGNKKSNVPYKDFFEALGFEHTSIDLNGLDGALPLDLCQPLNLGQFEMVTNIGTSEHVENQETVWRNMVDSLGPYGVLISITPLPGDWKHHGRYYPTENFYRDLCAGCGLHLERLYQAGDMNRRNLFMRATKTEDRPFTYPLGMFINEQGEKVGAYKS